MRDARSSPPAHRGARVIGTDALRFVLILREPSDGEERKQDSEDDPDINAHQSSLAAALPANSSLTTDSCPGPALANGLQVVKSFRNLLTDHCQSDILQSGPGWRGPNAPRAMNAWYNPSIA